MKNKTQFTTTIFLGLAVLITLGCQIASQAQPTSMPDSADTSPVNPPEQEATITPVPKYDISSAVLTLDDLPPGFEELNPQELGMSLDDFNSEGLQPEEVFIFINSQNFQMVFGFNFLLANKLDRVGFDVGISQPEVTLPALVDGMGSDIQDEKILEGFDGIGEKQIGMTMIANMEGVPVQVEVLMFRRDMIGAMLMSMVLDGESPNITLHDQGIKLDQHIQDSLLTQE